MSRRAVGDRSLMKYLPRMVRRIFPGDQPQTRPRSLADRQESKSSAEEHHNRVKYVCPLCFVDTEYVSIKRFKDHLALVHGSAIDAVRLPPKLLKTIGWSWCFHCSSYQRLNRRHRSGDSALCPVITPPDTLRSVFPGYFPGVPVPDISEFLSNQELEIPESRIAASQYLSDAMIAMFKVINVQELYQIPLKFYTNIPRVLHGEFTRALSLAVRIVNSDPSRECHWIPLMMFSRWCLRQSTRGGSALKKRHLKALGRRLSAFIEGKYDVLHCELLRCLEERQNSLTRKPKSSDEAMINACKSLTRQGKFSNALQTLFHGGIAPSDEVTYEILQDKHPQGEPFEVKTSDTANTSPITGENVRKQLDIINTRSAAGPMKIHPRHLKLCSQVSDDFVRILTVFCNTVYFGRVPPTVRPILVGANLTALNKKSKTNTRDVRPIAVGCTLRRFVCAIATRRAISATSRYLRPIQLGVSVSGGCEAITHAVRSYYENSHDESTVLFQMDLQNAFNVVSRRAILDSVRSHCPDLVPLVTLLYGQPFPLTWNNRIIMSSAGVAQGDPLGPVLFCLVFQTLLNRIADEIPHALIVAYIDDCTMALSIPALNLLLDMMDTDPVRELGFHLNTSKCKILIPRRSSIRFEDFQSLPCQLRVSSEGFICLGTPIGTQSFCLQQTSKKMSECVDLLGRVSQLDDLQVEFQLYRYSVNHLRLVYLWRTTPPMMSNYEPWTNARLELLKRLLFTTVAPGKSVVAQAALSLKKGGLGLKGDVYFAAACYTASAVQSSELVAKILRCDEWKSSELEHARSMLREAIDEDILDVTDLDSTDRKIQRRLVQARDETRLRRLRTNADSARQAKRLGHISKHGGTGQWLRAVPTYGRHLTLSSRQFAVSCRYLLGSHIYTGHDACQRCHKLMVDVHGDHTLHCHHTGLKTVRHNALRDLLARYCRSSGMTVQVEVECPNPSGSGRPADILVYDLNGDAIAYDVSIVSPYTRYVEHDASNIFAVHEQAKNQRYGVGADGLLNARTRFEPLILSTYGSTSSKTEKFLSRIAKNMALHWDADPRTTLQQLKQQVAILIARYNANAHLDALSRIPARNSLIYSLDMAAD